MTQSTNVSLFILSCDAYEDVLEPFFILKERYWPDCKYPVYIATETKDMPYPAQSLKVNLPITSWTERIRLSLEQIPTDYVIMMDSDMFIRRPVDQARIDYCLANFGPNVAAFSFELEYAPTLPSPFIGFRRKPKDSSYLCSCQPTLWHRETLIKLLGNKGPMTPWQWERTKQHVNYLFYVNSGDEIIDIGYHPTRDTKQWYGVRKGKWVKSDVVPLFEKEGIKIEFYKRGFFLYNRAATEMEVPDWVEL